MFSDESAPETLSITVNGEEHSYEPTVDTDHDGLADTVHVVTGNGSYDYTDTDGDGVADSLTAFDSAGQQSLHATFDPATGGWSTSGDPSIDLNASIDSDGDGVPDTVLTHNPDGSTVLATDLDGDGSADIVTSISADGDYTTSERANDGTWTEISHGDLSHGPAPSATRSAHSVIDPTSGQWVRR